MDSFIENLKLPIEFTNKDDGVAISKFNSSDLFAKVYAILDRLEYIKLDNEVSDMSLFLDTFRWVSGDNKYLITLKADYETNTYTCTVETEE